MIDEFIDNKIVLNYFELLNSNNIRYALIKNISNELPNNLKNGKDIDIVINLDDKKKFDSVMVKIGRKYIHPWGWENGWQNLYGLPKFEFWRLFCKDNVYIDVTYQLCCKSLMPNVWIPLDNYIQERIWSNRYFDKKNGWWILDNETQYVYCIVRCVFDKCVFSEAYINELECLSVVVDSDEVKKMLSLIFFGFTKQLLILIKNKKFHDIKNRYIEFNDY